MQPDGVSPTGSAGSHVSSVPTGGTVIRPTGTVTFLFAEVDPEQHANVEPSNVADYDNRFASLLGHATSRYGGYLYKVVGTSSQAAFSTAAQAVAAALEAQKELAGQPGLAVRMAIHSGVTDEPEGDYAGPLLNRVARVLAAGHPGQVLMTQATAELVRDTLPEGVSLRDLGEHTLRDLIHPERIFQLVATGLPADFPLLKTLAARPNNLPLQPTTLVGRASQVAGVEEILLRQDVILLTLTGPPGVGKTRLALQVAADLLDRFEHGVFFADLAPLSDPQLILPAIGQALGLQETGGLPLADTLRAYLSDKRMLLVLDNFEQITEAGPTVAQIVEDAPGLKVLVTSRAPLHLSMEHEYAVPPLSLPGTGHLPPVEAVARYEAIQLFVERARAVKPDFQLDKANAQAVVRICSRLDGLPLAIELAAARARILAPQAMLARLNKRLSLLTGGARDLPARQQTLRNTIEWSYDLLDGSEKTLFRRMAVFVGGRSLKAIEDICEPAVGEPEDEQWDLGADLLDTLGSLVDESLVRQEEGAGGEPRFLMLETVHEYARERLEESGELEELRRRHAHFFLQLAEKANVELRRARQALWFQRLEEEHGNMRAALAWCQGPGGEIETGLRIAAALGWFWEVHGHLTEGRRWIAGLLERRSTEPDATDGFAEARARVLGQAGNLADSQGDQSTALAMYEESLRIWRQRGDMGRVAGMLNNMGVVAWNQGDLRRAREFMEESLTIKRRTGDKEAIASTLSNLGMAMTNEGDFSAAQAALDESLVLFREVGDTTGVATSVSNLGILAFVRGDLARARSQMAQALRIFHEVGDVTGIAECLEGLAAIIAHLTPPNDRASGRLSDAARLLGAAEVLREEAGVAVAAPERQRYEGYLAAVRSRVDAEDFSRLWAEGRAMPKEQAVNRALALA